MSVFFEKHVRKYLRNKAAVFSIISLLILGVVVRFWDLAWHFSHVDDLGIMEVTFAAQKHRNIFHLSTCLTNAPFEYLFTYFLINPSMDYREILFWGRLPSCVAGSLALFVLVLFYARFGFKAWAKCFFALALAVCSWESIAFAKQAHSYAIGILAASILLLALVRAIDTDSLGLKKAFVLATVLALACSMQYQAFLFVPAFYLTLFFWYYPKAEKKQTLLRNFFVSSATFVTLVLPLWWFLLREHFAAKIHVWALESSGEFALNPVLFRDLGANGLKILWFYLSNLYVIFEAKIGFFPEQQIFFPFVSAALFFLFALGISNFFMTSNRRVRFVGLFFGLFLLTWWIMIPLKHLPYGPSRHTLILLPFFCVVAAEGGEGLSNLSRKLFGKNIPQVWQDRLLFGIGLIVVVIFLANFGTFLKERRDPVVGKEIVEVLEAYDVDEIFFDKRSLHLEYLKEFRDIQERILEKPINEVRTIAFFSRYPSASFSENCSEYIKRYNYIPKKSYQELRRSGSVPIRAECSDFVTIFKEEKGSGVMETFSRKIPTVILTNRLFCSIESSDPEKKKIAEKLKQGS